MESKYYSNDDSSSTSVEYDSKDTPRKKQRKTIHPSRYAHILELTTKDEQANTITVCSIQDYRRSGTFDSEDNNPPNDDYLVSYPDDDSDMYSISVGDDKNSSIRNSIYSVKSGQDIKDEVYSIIDAKLAETICDLNASLEELDKCECSSVNTNYINYIKQEDATSNASFQIGNTNNVPSQKEAILKENILEQISSPAFTVETPKLDKKAASPRLGYNSKFGFTKAGKSTFFVPLIVENSDESDASRNDEVLKVSRIDENVSSKVGSAGNNAVDDAADDASESEQRRFRYCFDDSPSADDGECPVVLIRTGRAASIQRALKYSGFKKLPEGVELTLGELRAMALRQQQQIDCQHQLLAAREQRLRFLKQQEARHHQVAAENERLRRLRERVEAQELKLRRLRALRGQLDQTNLNNQALTSDLESIRALFNEKEKELSVAVAKVEELTRQLEEVRRGRTPARAQPPAALELDKLRRELMYRNKLNEQQNARLSQQREALTARQAEMASIDQRISELQGRLQRKRVANRQLATHLSGKHHAPRTNNSAPVQLSNYPNSNSGAHGGTKNQPSAPRANVAAVEPYNHVPHAHSIQALKHNAAQNKLGNQNEMGNHISQQDSHYLQQKQYANQPLGGVYPQRIQAGLLQTEAQFPAQYPAKQVDGNYQGRQLDQQNDQKILLDHINKYNQDLQKTVNHNHNQNLNPTPVYNQQNKQRTNEQEFLPEFAASKSDPKYQTLPYNTKFTANGSSKSKGQFYDENKNTSDGNKVPSSNAVTSVSGGNPNRMTAHSTPLTISKGLATPLTQGDVNTGMMYLNSDTGYALQKSESAGKCNQEEKENMAYPNSRLAHNGELKLKALGGGRADLVRGFSQHTTVNATGQIKPVSSVAPTSVQVSSGKPSPVYQTSSTKIQPVQPQTVSHSSPFIAPKPALPPKPANKSNESSPPHQQGYSEQKQSEALLPPIPTTDPPTDLEQSNQNSHQSSSASSTDSQPMIIKARPLTIRKQPLSEQPKLKSLSSNITKTNNVNVATTRRIEMPPAYLFPEMEQISSEPLELQNTIMKNDKMNGNKIELPVLNSSPNSCDVTDRAILLHESSETSSEDQSDKMGVANVTEQFNAVDLNHPSDNIPRRIKKGNLKQSGKVNLSRRVSFDPLALLLDASLEGELELVKKTATQVANASAANDEGITALHNAICAGHFEIVKFLVEFGCDVNAQDSDGWTPLHCAASCNNVAMVRFLVENGACIFATTLSDHETAAQKCEEDEEGFDGCSEYLYSVQEKLGIMNGGAVFAVFPYAAQEPDELSFLAGARLAVVRKGDDAEREWWWARQERQDPSLEGYVPRNLLGLYPRVTPKQE